MPGITGPFIDIEISHVEGCFLRAVLRNRYLSASRPNCLYWDEITVQSWATVAAHFTASLHRE